MRYRALDLVVCVLALPLLLPVMAVLAIAVFLDSPGPVLYRASRIGRGGRPFQMLKFRSMRHGTVGPSLSMTEDERYTPLGSWLRRHRLDELPQIFNVLRGDMRLVGPRPELAEFVAAYPEQYSRILSVLPGVTGPTQLRFFDEDRLLSTSSEPITLYRDRILPSKIEVDLAYVARPSVRGDLAVLWSTILLPARRLRTRAALLGMVQEGVAPTTRLALLLSVIALALAGVFVVEAGSV